MKYNSEIPKILVTPLNWGLGHATRCIPIIRALIKEGFEPILAGDGESLILLQKEFSKLKSYKLPTYHIQYTKKGKNLKFKLLLETPRILNVIKKEQELVAEIIKKENIRGIISDNRFGVRSSKIPSVYITHQINVLSGITSFFTSKFHQKIILKFDECWIPDYETPPFLAGRLSHSNNTKLNVKYIGPLSRFKSTPTEQDKKYDIMVLLSGPEPQRTLLEEKLVKELEFYSKKVVFIRGIITDKPLKTSNKNIEIIDFMMQRNLQKAIQNSKIIIARSGYSTIMDLEKLEAKAFFIPTPGQYEQMYLAKYLKEQEIAPYALQREFKLDLVEKTENYKGFKSKKVNNSISFDLFKNT